MSPLVHREDNGTSKLLNVLYVLRSEHLQYNDEDDPGRSIKLIFMQLLRDNSFST